MLCYFQMTEAHRATSPLDPGVDLYAHSKEDADQGEAHLTWRYQSMVGSLMYLALGTRPDLAFAVAALSRYNSNPRPAHLTTAQRVLRYVKLTRAFRIHFPRDATIGATIPTITDPDMIHLNSSLPAIIGFTNSDFAGDRANRKSQSSYVFIHNGVPISWRSQK